MLIKLKLIFLVLSLLMLLPPTKAQPASAAVKNQLQEKIFSSWEKTRSQLDQVPINPIVNPIAAALPYHTFKITLQGLGYVRFVALMALPIRGEEPNRKPLPVIITAPGFGGIQQGVMLSECQRGYAIIQVFPRGMGESAEHYKIPGNKLTHHLLNPDSMYYRGAYADVMRVIDYVNSREDLDHHRISLVGTSQGGGIALAVASIDKRIKTVVAHVPFLCNFQLAAQSDSSLVKQLLDKAGKNNFDAIAALAYIDPLYLVTKLHASVLMSAGGLDKTCPEQTIRTVYNHIKAEKELKYYPTLKHTSCLDFYKQTWQWLNQKL
jgi:cephalosporin-C deacetylase